MAVVMVSRDGISQEANINGLAGNEIAVIGVSCRTSGAATVEEFWDLLDQGECRVAPVPESRIPGYSNLLSITGSIPQPMAALLERPEEFDAEFFGIKPSSAEVMDPQHRLLLEVSWHALESAGLAPADVAGQPVGVFAGISSYDYRELAARWGQVSSSTLAGSLHAFLSNRISFHFDLRGPSLTIDTACSSGLTALNLAVTSIRAGQCSMAIVGAANLICDGFYFATLQRAGVLSRTGRSVGFDTAADGYVRGEGAACVVLKPLSAAVADGDPVYAVIAGIGMNHDGHSAKLTVPSAKAQSSLIRQALTDAGIPGSAIGYIEAHGTGTAVGDPAEMTGIIDGLGVRSAPRMSGPDGHIWVGTVKANVGHTEAAAGLLGMLKAIGVLRRGHIPSMPGFRAVSTSLDIADLPVRITDRSLDWPSSGTPRMAGVNCFGFGGANAHVILREPPSFAQDPVSDDVLVAPVSATTPEALRVLAAGLARVLAQDKRSLDAACWTLQTGRAHHPERRLVIATDRSQLVAGLHAIAEDRSHPTVAGPQHHEACSGSLAHESLKLWLEGESIDWRALRTRRERPRRVPLVPYPFDRRSHWLPRPTDSPQLNRADSDAAPPTVESTPNDRTRPAVKVTVRDAVAAVLLIDQADLGDDDSFDDLGLDSILAVECIQKINQRLGSTCRAELLRQYPTCRLLTAHLVGEMELHETVSIQDAR